MLPTSCFKFPRISTTVLLLAALLLLLHFPDVSLSRLHRSRRSPFPLIGKQAPGATRYRGFEKPTYNHTSNKYPHSYVKRAEDYDFYKCRGERLLDMILHGQPSAQRWQPDDLFKSGWRGVEPPKDTEAPKDLADVLPTLGIAHGQADIHHNQWNQDTTFTDSDGHADRPATKGYYYNDFLPSTIIGGDNYSPSFFAGPNGTIPPLNRWSDIIWLLWTEETGDKAKDLKYIFRANIVTDSTRQIMEHIAGADRDDLNLPWPGRTFDLNTDNGKALLGTSHGTGVAYLVADHSDVLGRRVPFARMFTVDTTDSDEDSESSEVGLGGIYYYILWELRDTVSGNAPTTTAPVSKL